MTEFQFTHAGYQLLIKTIQSYGYQFVSFGELNVHAGSQVILRHDVDLSLECAVRIAEIEAEIGITSVFHILMTAEVYNPASQQSQLMLTRIRDLGHRIGLHIDPIALDGQHVTDISLQERLAILFKDAHQLLGPVDSYSIHRPAANGRIDDFNPVHIPFSVPIYADDDVYRHHLFYRSDSRRQWRHGSLLDEIADFQGHSLQLNLHPIWWTETEISRNDLLLLFLKEQYRIAEQYLSDNLSF